MLILTSNVSFFFSIGKVMVSLLKPGLLKSTAPQVNPPNSHTKPSNTSTVLLGGKQIKLTLPEQRHMLTVKQKFKQRKGVKSHIPATQRTCITCQRKFRHGSILQLHRFYTHDIVPYHNRLKLLLRKWGIDCMLRGRHRDRYEYEQGTRTQYELRTRPQIVRCGSCGSQQRSPAALASHHLRVHLWIKCVGCKLKFSNVLRYHSHVRKKHRDKLHR